MDRVEELRLINCQDVWPKLYYFLAKGLTTDYGLVGEAALRRGIRDYGENRGLALRKKHLEYNENLSTKTLFSYYDLPGDPRFKRNLISLNKNQRLSETLVCPVADTWKGFGEQGNMLGRIYCEEFHHAMFRAYLPEIQVNLGQTLTQDRDNHCRFSVYWREANATDTGRTKGEKSFDSYTVPHYRDGVETLIVKMYNYFTLAGIAEIGQQITKTIKKSLNSLAENLAEQQRKFQDSQGLTLTSDWYNKYFPINLYQETQSGVWLEFENTEPWELFRDNLACPLKKELGL